MLPTIIIIVALLTSLISCTNQPVKNLAFEAVLVYQKDYTPQEIRKLLGPPARILRLNNDKEEWYYYQPHKSFWGKIPLLGPKLHHPRVEVLRITFDQGHVSKCLYYVLGEKDES